MVIDFDRYRQTRSLGLSIPFGERVAIARKDQGLTQEQLGEHLGYTQQNMSRLEIGKVKFTTATAAAAIALNKSNILLYYCNSIIRCQAFNELKIKGRNRPEKAYGRVIQFNYYTTKRANAMITLYFMCEPY